MSAWLLPFSPFACFDVLCLPVAAVPVLAPASGLFLYCPLPTSFFCNRERCVFTPKMLSFKHLD